MNKMSFYCCRRNILSHKNYFYNNLCDLPNSCFKKIRYKIINNETMSLGSASIYFTYRFILVDLETGN